MTFIPHVIDAEYMNEYKIRLRFNDGTLRIVDLEIYTLRGGVFERLKDKDYFRNFFIDLNTLCWPNGADIAPERLYELGEIIDREETGIKRQKPHGHQPQI